MAEEEKEDAQEIIKIPVAKKSKLLLDIEKQLNGTDLDTTAEIVGHKYYMTTITADEGVWADAFCNMASEVSAYSSIRIPRLAAAIKKIDNKDINELFDFPDDIDKNTKEFHTSSKYRKRYWIMQQMLVTLGEMPDKFIVELWSEYSSMVARRDKSWNDLKKSSKKTPGGNSNHTSSPEKESSSATQTSAE